MTSAHRSDVCVETRGWARLGSPPFIASRRRRAVAVLALVGCVSLGGACSSSSAQSTTSSTALKIPPPFEVGQQVGLGDVAITVSSFERIGDAVTVRVKVANETTHPISIAAMTAFSIFYDTGRHAPSRATGLSSPLAQNASGTATLEFSVPTRYQFPLVWFAGSAPGSRAGTIVLRGNHA
jgi:hypothetical protein